ncbi:lipase-like PAD4 [Abrus precatorius]|uniref:Lipase-like PAD4 n=1 Tax=Abrus precatorius TaxID=3816 RepID=A0A8B8K4T7_ABRPR|nr:lipase-like PAD4 [Abrus precatorius]
MVADETSPFETSEMLATLLASTPLLSESWRLCTTVATTAPLSFMTERSGGGVVYVAFPGAQMAGGSYSNWSNLVPLNSIGDVPLFSSHRYKEGDEPVMVHAAMLNLFSSIFKPFQNQMLAMIGNTNTKSFVITGHSIGGATASLCALWLLSYLQHISSSVSVLCITFGSPLLGNVSFAHAILNQRWGGNFCHLVSKHDIMPRLLLAPITPYSAQLNFLLQFWQFSMTAPSFGKLAVQVSDKQKEDLFNFLKNYLHAATLDEGSAPIMFHPFGSYFFVSEEGAVCVDSSTAVIKMMHLMFASGSPACSIEDHLKYGDYIKKLSLQFLSQKNSMEGNIPDSSYEAGLELAIRSLGLANQVSAIEPAKKCLEMIRRKGPSPTMNAAILPITLSKVVPYRAEIEWYKAWCDQQIDQLGYYDLFKRRRSTTKMAMKVNMNRHILARFWKNVIEMWERNELPHDLAVRDKWVNASHSYKLLVEPLDIAEYYGKGMHITKGHYIQHGRERRYEIFDRWWKDRVDTAEENNGRSQFASLTQDSCFWARVEEARDWLNRVRSGNDTSKLVVLWDNIEKFEKYAMELIDNKEVSLDVLAKNSSYSIWVEDLRVLRELRAKVKTFPHNFNTFLDEVFP